MKILLFIAMLTWISTASGPAMAQNGAVKPYFSPPTFHAPQPMTPPVYTPGWGNWPHSGPYKNKSGNIYIQPHWDTHKNDLRDQRSWASPKPDPFANDPRNYFQQRPKPRGYIVEWN